MVDIKQKIVLGNLPQKVHIKMECRDDPVLLFLHGGPGVPNRHSIMSNHRDLAENFIIVTWDQRGTGGSYKSAKKETFNVEQFVEDAQELVLWLCRRFNKGKIFIIGGSWGSELGTLLAYKYPEHIAAYIGFGQMVNGSKNEELSYNFALAAAQKANDKKSVKKLEKTGRPSGGIYKDGLKALMVQRKIMMRYGGYSQNKKKRNYKNSVLVPILFSGEYTFFDVFGIVKGYKSVLQAMWKDVISIDFVKDCTEFQMPYFIFDGMLDRNTPAELVKEYFDKIQAPQKELVWFEESGHNPLEDEPEKFKQLLKEKLLAVGDK